MLAGLGRPQRHAWTRLSLQLYHRHQFVGFWIAVACCLSLNCIPFSSPPSQDDCECRQSVLENVDVLHTEKENGSAQRPPVGYLFADAAACRQRCSRLCLRVPAAGPQSEAVEQSAQWFSTSLGWVCRMSGILQSSEWRAWQSGLPAALGAFSAWPALPNAPRSVFSAANLLQFSLASF